MDRGAAGYRTTLAALAGSRDGLPLLSRGPARREFLPHRFIRSPVQRVPKADWHVPSENRSFIVAAPESTLGTPKALDCPMPSANCFRLIRLIPAALITLRCSIGPFLVWDALDGEISRWFLGGVLAGFLSDVFDGSVARRLGVSTARLRQADSWADI